MKAEINLENKAKVFALYWGQEVMKGVWKNAQHPPLKITFDTIGQCHNYRLELKPLSLISDEDKKVLVNILFTETINTHIGLSKTCNPDFGFSFWVLGLKEYCFYWDFDVICLEKGNGNYLPDSIKFIYASDYLRSKGYALPWMGLSVEDMVEAGWIKLTNQ
jgi:hypothetical protein